MLDVEAQRVRDWGAQTDVPSRIRQTGKIVRLQKKAPAGPKAPPKSRTPDLNKIIGRLRLSVPLLKYARTDKHTRHLVLALLIKMATDEGETIPCPEGALLHPMTPNDFDQYRETLGGITEDNQAEVLKALRDMGIEQKVQVARVGPVRPDGPRGRVIMSEDEEEAPPAKKGANAVMALTTALQNLLHALDINQEDFRVVH